jgi:2-methylcitrate dehydratase PrpD
MADGFGQTWELENLSIKPFPACHFVHSSTWAAVELADEHGLDHRDIAEIFVRIPPEGEALVLEPLSAKYEPRTPYDAKFSLPFTVAHHLVHGRLGVSSFSADAIRDPEVLALARRVRREPLAGREPSRFAGGARVVTRGGDEFDKFIPHAPGSPRNPLDEGWLLTKFQANAEMALEATVAGELAGALRSLDAAAAIGPVLALAQPAGPGIAPS